MKISNKTLNETKEVLSSLSLVKVKKQLKKINKIKTKETIIKVGIARTFTLEGQTDYINLALNTLPFNFKINLGELNNIEQEINNKDSKLLINKPDIIIVLWRAEELVPAINKDLKLTKQKLNNFIVDTKKRIKKIIKNYIKTFNAPLILSNLPLSHLGIKYNNSYYGLYEFIETINSFIKELAITHNNISLFDFCGISNEVGKDFLDIKMDFYAKQAISMQHINTFSMSLVRTIRPLLLPSAKAVAIDLDNVLWGGVLGEDGLENLKTSHDFPGNIYREIQKKLISLKKDGFLIFLLSKNNLKDVKDAFSVLKNMPITLRDFDDICINWKEKHINLIKISKKFNIGLSSIVFIDDQKFEQDQMKYNLKEVNVLNVTSDPLSILKEINDCALLDKHVKTNEDYIRNKDYKANIKRENLKKNINNSENFLKSLKIKSKVFQINQNNAQRAFDMIHKINQFNFRTFRKSKKDIMNELNNKNYINLLCSISDKFGDQGTVGLIVGKINRDNSVFIENFLLSCRVIGRGVEDVLFYSFLKILKNKKINILSAEYIKSDKNSQVKDLYTRLGLSLIKKLKDRNLYKTRLPIKLNKPKWIKIYEK